MHMNNDYSFREGKYDFYIASSSKDLMSRIADIMRRNGYIGYADGGGKMHYIVDGSRNIYKASDSIMHILSESEAAEYNVKEEHNANNKQEAVAYILETYNFPKRLKGYAYLQYTLELMLDEGNKATPDKSIYAQVCERFKTGRRQLDRVLNYSFKKVGLTGTNTDIMAELIVELRDYYDDKRLGLEES